MSGRLFIYGLVCPISNKIFYVGQSTDVELRLKTHIGSYYTNAPKLSGYLKSLLKKGKLRDVKAVILQKCRNRSTQYNAEIKWIKKLSEHSELMNTQYNSPKVNDSVITLDKYVDLLNAIKAKK
jgi:predicted GIY-YIG superfamily endonuclease